METLIDLLTRNLYCAQCHGDGASVGQQRISVRCDNTELADQCLPRHQLTAEQHYVPGTLSWQTNIGPADNCTDQFYVIKVWRYKS